LLSFTWIVLPVLLRVRLTCRLRRDQTHGRAAVTSATATPPVTLNGSTSDGSAGTGSTSNAQHPTTSGPSSGPYPASSMPAMIMPKRVSTPGWLVAQNRSGEQAQQAIIDR
jgi:hypothetical protein